MGDLAITFLVAAAVVGLIALLVVMSIDFRDDDYASMDRRLARREGRRLARADRRGSPDG